MLAAGFIVSGIVLLASKFSNERKDTISIPTALLIGVMQGLSIIPAISRSGLTIAVMLLLGHKTGFSFQIFVFALDSSSYWRLGINALSRSMMRLHWQELELLEIAAALVVTVAVSFLALKLLQKTLSGKQVLAV